jgi:hypothetical protein
MAIISQVQSRLSVLIDRACEAADRPRPLMTARASKLGTACDRQIWYALRWAHPPAEFNGRTLRIFARGHHREPIIARYLEMAGLTVERVNPETGEPWAVRFDFGPGQQPLTGHLDGVVTGVPEAPAKRHVLEIKTMKASRWLEWRRRGVAASHPTYWVQTQIYMLGMGLDRALVVAENQDTCEIEAERVELDPVAAERLVERARRIGAAETAPQRLSDDPTFWQCRECPARELCHGVTLPQRNCRTCMAGGATGQCTRFSPAPTDDPERGCDFHLFDPALMPGDLTTWDDSAMVATYMLRNGDTFIDGQRREAS